LLGRENAIRIIGTRHGEKLYESLVSRQEIARAEDLGRYFRIPADSRDLNYNKYFVDGEIDISQIEDYTSHNAPRLNVAQVKQVLRQLSIVREAMDA
jgi:UDP-N-acetylglucosamine 4,6-dehydratase